MKKLFSVFWILLILVSCLASVPTITGSVMPLTQILPTPLQGELYSVSLETTLLGLQACLRGDMGTGIFSNPARPDSLIFMWRSSITSWSFVGLNLDPKTMVKDLMALRANYSNIFDYKGMMDALRDVGWGSISYKIVEGSLRNPVLIATINKILEGISGKFVTFLVMPLGVNPSQIGVVNFEKINSEDSVQ